MGAWGAASGDLPVDAGVDQTITLDQLVADFLEACQFRWRCDAHLAQAVGEPGDVKIDSRGAACVVAQDFIDPVGKHEAPVFDVDPVFRARQEPALQVNHALRG